MRLMLASPLATMPQQMFPQPFPAFGSSSTAGALVPYKAQEVHLHALLLFIPVPSTESSACLMLPGFSNCACICSLFLAV